MRGEKILIVEDVITTGGSVKEAMAVLKKYGVEIAGVVALVLRGRAGFKKPVRTLFEFNWRKYRPSRCPLCREKIPLAVPGTKQSQKNTR